MQTYTLEYHKDPCIRFQAILDWPYPVLLDSCYSSLKMGRYDVFTANPQITIETLHDHSIITDQSGHCIESSEDPFKLIQQYLLERQQPYNKSLPFIPGGALGYLSYDLGRYIYPSLPQQAADDVPLPLMSLGLYNWLVVTDHHQQQSYLYCAGELKQEEQDKLLRLFSQHNIKSDAQPFKLNKTLKSNMHPSEYNKKFNAVKAHLLVGDTYQVNLAQRFSQRFTGSPWDAYMRIRTTNPAPYSAYINHPKGTVLSFSPESFLETHDHTVLTRPIKGTAPRGKTPKDDAREKAKLKQSKKNQAENIMIVDLIRNDLGRVCEPGSVTVDNLLSAHTFPSVHHLISTVRGTLCEGYDSIDCLRNCFPGGSVTGAPKKRTMEIIESLEPHRRSVYCGSIGYFGPNGHMNTSIAIRTLICTLDQMIHCYSGGGLVIDSDLQEERDELHHKIRKIMDQLI